MSLSFAPRVRARENAPSRAVLIEKRLTRFPDATSALVRRFAASHPALADLALSFPALLFAIASSRDRAAARAGAEAVVAGRALRDAAAILGLPMWTRAFAPEAFARPLRPLPDSALFARRIANHLPRSPKRAAQWLDVVAEAAEIGDETIAIWIARELTRDPRKFKPTQLRLVCLWAWFSSRPETAAGGLTDRRWSPQMRFAAALDAACNWADSLLAYAVIGDDTFDGWLLPATVGGFDFAPLGDAGSLIAEGKAMQHCVRTYAHSVKNGNCRIWSIRRGDDRIATIEVGCRPTGAGFLTLRQARGFRNRRIDTDVERAIHEWMRMQPLRERPTAPTAKGVRCQRTAWTRLWRPFWLAKRRLPHWLPLSPSYYALYDLRWNR